MIRYFSPCLSIGTGCSVIAAYNYLVQGYTEHNVLLLLAFAAVNFLYCMQRIIGIIVLAVTSFGFLQHGYGKDGLFLLIFSLIIMLTDMVVAKKVKAQK